MKAELLLRERHAIAGNAFVEMVVWRVPASVETSAHGFKYRLVLVVDGICVLRYDNEAGKGDHKHVGDLESAYAFTSPAQLLADFWTEVDDWRTR